LLLTSGILGVILLIIALLAQLLLGPMLQLLISRRYRTEVLYDLALLQLQHFLLFSLLFLVLDQGQLLGYHAPEHNFFELRILLILHLP
jgi:hypothetical protein